MSLIKPPIGLDRNDRNSWCVLQEHRDACHGLMRVDATLRPATGPYVLGTSLATVVLMPSMSSSVASRADKKPDKRRHAELCTPYSPPQPHVSHRNQIRRLAPTRPLEQEEDECT